MPDEMETKDAMTHGSWRDVRLTPLIALIAFTYARSYSESRFEDELPRELWIERVCLRHEGG